MSLSEYWDGMSKLVQTHAPTVAPSEIAREMESMWQDCIKYQPADFYVVVPASYASRVRKLFWIGRQLHRPGKGMRDRRRHAHIVRSFNGA